VSEFIDRETMGRVAAEFGVSGERFAAMWGDFVEFREIVERNAEALGFSKGTGAFSRFGLAMLEAKEHGEREAVEGLVWNRTVPMPEDR
jgi:hypothetical protein